MLTSTTTPPRRHLGPPDGPPAPVDRPRPAWRDGLVPAVLVALPFVVVAVWAATVRSPVYLRGDRAAIDMATRQALSWHRLLGIYDRFGWYHPGPSYFYLLATVERVLGPHGAAVQRVTAALIDGTSAATSVLLIGRARGRKAGLAAAFAVAVMTITLGPTVIDDPWTPYIVVYPLLLAGVLTVLAAQGSLVAWLGTVVVGSFAVQTDVATAGIVAIYVVGGGLTCAYRRRRVARGDPPGRGRWAGAGLGAVLVAMWAPVVMQQVTTSPGNLTLLWRFFTGPQRHLGLHEGAVQLGIQGARVFGVASPVDIYTLPRATPALLELAAVALFVAAVLAVAVWVRHTVAALLAATGALGLLAALYSASSIVGPPYGYLLTWASAPLVLVVVAAALLVVRPLERIPRGATLPTVGAVAAVVALLVFAFRTPSVQVTSDPAVAQGWKLISPTVAAHPGQRVELTGLGMDQLEMMDGIGVVLLDHKVPFTVEPVLRAQYPPGHGGTPTYWLVFSNPWIDPPAGYQLLGNSFGTLIYVGEVPPPQWPPR